MRMFDKLNIWLMETVNHFMNLCGVWLKFHRIPRTDISYVRPYNLFLASSQLSQNCNIQNYSDLDLFLPFLEYTQLALELRIFLVRPEQIDRILQEMEDIKVLSGDGSSVEARIACLP